MVVYMAFTEHEARMGLALLVGVALGAVITIGILYGVAKLCYRVKYANAGNEKVRPLYHYLQARKLKICPRLEYED